MCAKILIVDDEPNMLRLIEYALVSAGYETQTARSGSEAIAQLQAGLPDLVILDVMLPDMSGINVCEHIRQQPESLHLPVIMLSALAQVSDKINGLKAGADEYLTKPMDLQELSVRIAALLARQERLIMAAPPTAPERGTTCRLIAVCGPKGGVGRTLIAANLGVALYQAHKQQLLLVDGDIRLGDLDLAFNARSNHNILDLLNRADDLDRDVIDTVLVTHTSGIKVLVAAGQFLDPPQANGDTFNRTIDGLAPHFDTMMIDMPATVQESTLDILEAASKIIITVTAEISSLRNARLLLDLTQRLNISPSKVVVVLNRYDRKNDFQPRDIEQVLKLSIAAKIAEDHNLAHYSLTRGVPLVISHPRSQIAKDIVELAGLIK